MQTEINDNKSVCATPQERQRLLRLFQLLADIDKTIKKKGNEASNHKRNTNNTRKAK